MSYSLNMSKLLKGGYIGDYIGDIAVLWGDSRSLD